VTLRVDTPADQLHGGASRVRRRPVVAHVLREYLAPTETFVYNQISTLQRYRPITVAYRYRREVDLPVIDGTEARELLSGPWTALSKLAYRGARAAIPRACDALAARVVRERAALLHVHYLVDARFLLRLKRLVDLPAVVSAYGYDVSSFPRAFRGLGRRYLEPIFSEFDLFLAMSEDMRADLIRIGCPEDRIRVHYYGSDTRRFRSPARRYDREAPLTVLCCGTLQAKKGQHLVLEALAKLADRGLSGFRVVLVGDGPMRAEIEAWVRRKGWQDRVTLTGHVPYSSPELVEHYRRADVFALPSVTVDGDKEGIPGVIVEAMAAGLPVVSTYHAGIPAAVQSDLNGLLVPEYDVDGLAGALERLLTDPALRRRLGEAAGRRASTDLDLEAGTRMLEEIYDELLQEQAPAARSHVPAFASR
jgi:colanic acid/amylovoran biosynthesis glycosyltransferase